MKASRVSVRSRWDESVPRHSVAAYGDLAIFVLPPSADMRIWFWRCDECKAVTKSAAAARRHVTDAGRWRPERRPGRLIRNTCRPIAEIRTASPAPRWIVVFDAATWTGRDPARYRAEMVESLREWTTVVQAARIKRGQL